MQVIGIDPHKHSHTAVLVASTTGARGPETTVRARRSGHEQLIRWGRQHAPAGRLWALEDVRTVSTQLERFLLAQGETVVRVPPKMTGPSRQSDRRHGKSDPIDAVAIAAAALREPDLPRAQLDGPELEARLLVDRREQLINQRTREINRLRDHLHVLDPDLEPKSLTSRVGLEHVGDWLDVQPLADPRVMICRDLLDNIERLTSRIHDYHHRIKTLVRRRWPQLLQVYGCQELTAAKLVGEIGPPGRFTTSAKLALHAGCAPLLATSGQHPERHRLNRHGNRQINAAIHRIAIVQARAPGTLGHAYVQRRIAEGKTKREALRALKRHLVKAVHQLLTDNDLPEALT